MNTTINYYLMTLQQKAKSKKYFIKNDQGANVK